MNYALVYIIILNWNGYSDTISCLDSLLKNIVYSRYRIIICDNNSQDRSIEKIEKWSKKNSVNLLVKQYNDRPQYLFSNNTEEERMILLIKIGSNLGFAGGNNVGIKYALTDSQCKYVWILNNDTIVTPHSLSALVKRCQQDSKIGICGSKILCFDNPSLVQSWGGGTYNKWIGITEQLGEGENFDRIVDVKLVDKTLDFIVGASMLVSVDFINEIGLMSEEYFLYHEEIDWSTRASGKYSLAYADESIIYHKGGGSTGTDKTFTTAISDYYSTRGILLYTKKYFPIALPTIYLKLIYAIVQRFRRKQYDRIPWIIALMLNRDCTIKNFE